MKYAHISVSTAICLISLVCYPTYVASQNIVRGSAANIEKSEPLLRCVDCDDDPTLPPPSQAPAPANPVLDLFNVNPQQGLIEGQFSGGLAIIIDERLGTVDISTPTGTATVPLDAAILNFTNGDVARAEAIRADFHARLQDPLSTAMLWPLPGGFAVRHDSPTRVHPLSAVSSRSLMSPGRNSTYLMAGPLGGVSFQCSFYWDCSIIQTNYMGGGHDYAMGGWYASEGPGSPSDRQQWERERSSACFDSYIYGAAAAGALIATVGACLATPITAGGAAMVCAGTFIGYGAAATAATTNSLKCNSRYPGEHHW